jgi:outer membrane protein W
VGYESPLISENELLGVRCGYNWHDTLTLTTKMNSKGLVLEKPFKNKMQSIPVTVYYKYEFKESKFSVFGGAGATFMNLKWMFVDNMDNNKKELDKSKVSPHIAAGLEYRSSKLLGLLLDLKYTIGSEIKCKLSEEDDSLYFKRELGFQGALAVRFYAF